MSTEPLVVAKDLVKTYSATKVNAVDGVSFSIPAGQVLGLLGPNGAGKTTTVKMLLGLVEPTSGAAFLAGNPVQKRRSQAVAQAGVILEGARNIYWRLSARQNLAYFGRLRGLSGAGLKARIAEVLDLVGMSDRADEETRYLSRGMQQKIALAIALLHDPTVLLLDEPTLGLDVQAGRVIEQTIRSQAAEGKAILLTTHQMDLAQKVCDRIVVINKGKVVTEGATHEVVNYFGDEQQTAQLVLAGALPAAVQAAIKDKQPDIEVVVDGDQTELLWSAAGLSQADLLRLLGDLHEEGIVVRQFGLRKATLEEVFVRLTSGEEGEP